MANSDYYRVVWEVCQKIRKSEILSAHSKITADDWDTDLGIVPNYYNALYDILGHWDNFYEPQGPHE